MTGERGPNDEFSIKKYLLADKHGMTRHAYNAKVNIYRENAEPIYLGVQDAELANFGTVAEG